MEMPMEMEICSKVISNTDIQDRFSMPTRTLHYLSPFPDGQTSQILHVEDEEGEMWWFNLIIREGPHPKPVLSANWRRFVREKNLQQGFKVQFFMEPDGVTGGFKYKIKLKEPVVVFGKIIGYKPLRVG